MNFYTPHPGARPVFPLRERAGDAEVLQARFAIKAASYLTDAAEQMPHGITERLRAARMQALAQRRSVAAKPRPLASGWTAWLGSATTFSQPPPSGEADDGEENWSWWGRIATALPLVVLVVGLLTIDMVQQDNQAQEIAEVDAALLTDALPPSAFADAGFLQFLKVQR